MHRRDLTDALRPRPMREQVGHGQFGPPVGLVEIITVLGEAGQVDDAEI